MLPCCVARIGTQRVGRPTGRRISCLADAAHKPHDISTMLIDL